MPGSGMMGWGWNGMGGVGWLFMVLSWGLTIVGLVLVVRRSWDAGQSGTGARPGGGRRTQAELSATIRTARGDRN